MDVDLDGVIRIRFEDGRFPLLEEQFRQRSSKLGDPDLILERGHVSDLGTPARKDAFFSEGEYAITKGGGTCRITPGKIVCTEHMDEELLEENVLKPVLVGLLASKGWGLLHASAASVGESVVVFPAISGTGKTFVLLELLRRGAGFVCNNSIMVGNGGRFVAYPKPIRLVARHLKMFPDLMNTASSSDRERREIRKKMSAQEFSRSIRGGDPISRLLKYRSDSSHFCKSVRSQTLFPGSKVKETGTADHVFFLVKKKGQPRVVPSDPLRIAGLSFASTSFLGCCLHRTMSRLAGLAYPTEEETIASNLNFLKSVRCHEVHMGENLSEKDLSKVVDEIQSNMA
ncbi:MAG: hypothetical protein LUQ27_04600 [Methanomassiliicoccales archaeon]|nr:hypothetical protein [Methanomassiliicoccales archaeon]